MYINVRPILRLSDEDETKIKATIEILEKLSREMKKLNTELVETVNGNTIFIDEVSDALTYLNDISD